jgi:hypothetical protein
METPQSEAIRTTQSRRKPDPSWYTEDFRFGERLPCIPHEFQAIPSLNGLFNPSVIGALPPQKANSGFYTPFT